MKTLAKFLVIICGVLFLVGTIFSASFIWDAFLRTPSRDAESVVVNVEPGSATDNISAKLKTADLIPSRFGFKLYVRLIKATKDFQPGEFTIKKGSNYSSIVSLMTSVASDEVTITFPEGLSVIQMAERIDKAFGAGSGDVWRASLFDINWSETYSFVPETLIMMSAATDPLEGYLFPDTYRVSRSGFPNDLTYKLLTNFSEKLSPELRVEIINQGKTIHEVLTLASIVEREVMTDIDRAKVADLFWRRLGVGMALQADSTVHYVVGNDDKNVYTSDLDRSVDSPWNTYKYPGLPPGPICNPSLSAIKAVIYPEANDAWYFLTDADGNVHYARTNDEQNINKSLYLK
ncbi:MAG: endolytic transglycosylase MltG [Candidatus Uhrbacteria bacterium]